MTFLGKGYTYTVFDLGGGRVLKTEKPFLQKITDTYSYEGRNIPNYLRAVARLMDKKRVREINGYVGLHVDPKIVGHPVFLEGINYEQDKVKPLGDVLAGSDPAAQKRTIDRYIESILECWENGFSDAVFNFTINCGLGEGGRIVLLDFDEIVTSKRETEKRILSKRWRRSWTYHQLEPELRRYYRTKMDEIITVAALNGYWKDP